MTLNLQRSHSRNRISSSDKGGSMSDYLKHFEIYDNIFRIRAPGYDPGPGPGDGTLGGLGKNMIDVIVGEKYAAVWDTGNGDIDLKGYIEQYITDKPLIAFNSHGHLDHCRGNAQFEEVWIAKEDEKTANMFCAPDFIMHGHPYCEVVKNAEGGKLCFIEDGMVFDLGGRTLTIYRLPGHSPGCICALDSKCRVLFSGDSILKRIGINFANRHEMIPRFERIKALDFDVILGAHWDMPMDKDQIDRFIKICREFTPEKATPSVNRLNGGNSRMWQYYLENDFANPGFASISMRDLDYFNGTKEAPG